jgi:hypothetical protein
MGNPGRTPETATNTVRPNADCIKVRYGRLLLTVSISDTVRRMTMNIIDNPTHVLNVDQALIDHTEHLPETVTCHCGYRRTTDMSPASPTLAE